MLPSTFQPGLNLSNQPQRARRIRDDVLDMVGAEYATRSRLATTIAHLWSCEPRVSHR